VLLDLRTLDAIAAGSVTVAFRRWRRPTVRSGGTLTTTIGVLAIDSVDVIDVVEITDDDVGRAGYSDRDELLAALGDRHGELYRIGFHLAGPDPRIALREHDALTAGEIAELERRLARLDARGPWTEQVLRLIAARPGVRAGDLAEELGRERLAFKADVRKLKALGLTESLEVGYRLSPRGRAYLDR
jgi:hypothetical protein